MKTAPTKKQFREYYQLKHFNILECTFWDTPEKIKNNYEALNKILEDNNKKPTQERKNYSITQETLKESYNCLIDKEERENYLSFLKYYYFLSEPITLNQLKKNYNYKIFPYNLFTIKIKEKQQISTLAIDFVQKKIIIFYKDKEFYTILSDNIITVNKKFGSAIIIMVKSQDKNKNGTKEISFEPEFVQQIDIIYTIITYFAKKMDDKNLYELLEDDSYRPCGIILRAKIIKNHRVKVLGKDDRYAILGPSMIIIYKNEEMKDIRNVLPLFPLFMRINFIDKENKILFKYPSREQALSFYDNEHYTMWKTTLKKIINKTMISKMNILETFQVNENRGKDKIIKDIDTEIECTKEEINALKKKMEDTKNKLSDKNK
jgi:hypothetical protein